MRRDFSILLFGAAVALVAACGDDDGGDGTAPGTDGGPEPSVDGGPTPDVDGGPCPMGTTGPDCADCAEGWQDNDEDGNCTLGCDAPTPDLQLNCGDFGTCDDTSGTRGCVCDEAYAGFTCEECAEGYGRVRGACEPVLGVMDGLRHWYDAAEAVTNAEGEVTALPDAVGTLTLVGASGTRPSFVADGLGGRPAIAFDGSDLRLASTGSTDALADPSYTIFVVAAPVGLAVGRAVLSYRTGTDYGAILETATGGYRYVHRAPVGTTGGDSVVTARPLETPHLIRVLRVGGATGELVMDVADGADYDAFTDTQVTSSDPIGGSRALVLGDGPGTSFNGQIGEVLVYDRALDQADSDAVRDYLRRRWSM